MGTRFNLADFVPNGVESSPLSLSEVEPVFEKYSYEADEPEEFTDIAQAAPEMEKEMKEIEKEAEALKQSETRIRQRGASATDEEIAAHNARAEACGRRMDSFVAKVEEYDGKAKSYKRELEEDYLSMLRYLQHQEDDEGGEVREDAESETD